jgi:hypothetical protein
MNEIDRWFLMICFHILMAVLLNFLTIKREDTGGRSPSSRGLG